MSHEEITEEEEKFLKGLIDYAKEVHGEKWKGAMTRGIKIPEKGLEQKIKPERGKSIDEVVESLVEKSIILIEEEEMEHDSSIREVTYGEGDDEEAGREVEHQGYVRGRKKVEKLKLEEEQLEAVLEDLQV